MASAGSLQRWAVPGTQERAALCRRERGPEGTGLVPQRLVGRGGQSTLRPGTDRAVKAGAGLPGSRWPVLPSKPRGKGKVPEGLPGSFSADPGSGPLKPFAQRGCWDQEAEEVGLTLLLPCLCFVSEASIPSVTQKTASLEK